MRSVTWLRIVLIQIYFALIIIPLSLFSQQEENILVHPWNDTSLSISNRVDSLLIHMTLEEKVSQLLYNSPEIPRLDIPKYNWWNEALHGVARAGNATVFPQAIGLAATFNGKLIEKVAMTISDEARIKYNAAIEIDNRERYTGLTFWSPNINIFRDPRWGRGQETYGEDPFLTSTIGLAFVAGLQGDNSKYLKTAACAKHYVVHSGPEALRHEFDAIPPIKDFYETYLPAFDNLVRKGKVAGVMCAYNMTFGEPCCGSKFLDIELLRQDWGFKGYHVSDCWAISDIHAFHKYTSNAEESAALALKSGIDLNCGTSYNSLLEAFKNSKVTEQQIDTALSRLLRTRIMLGMFDPHGSNPYDTISKEKLRSPEHILVAREAATKSIVMLKNDGILPLANNQKKIVVMGPYAADSYVMLGNYNGTSGNIVTILEGISNLVNPGTALEYKPGFLPLQDVEKSIDWITTDAHSCDAIIVVMGISNYIEGEEGDALASTNKGDKKNLNFPQHQLDFLEKLSMNGDKPIISVITGGSPLYMEKVHEYSDAILWTWYGGEQGGTAVADIIFGEQSPSGRLPISFPTKDHRLPEYEDYSMHNRTYRYMLDEPMYPFGFGLSFAKINYSEIYSKNENEVSVVIRNQGDISIEEVVQLYISFDVIGLELPKYALVAIQIVALDPNESKKIRFKLEDEMFIYYDNNGLKNDYKGSCNIMIGGSSPSTRALELGGNQWEEIKIIR